jgi:hypothetical protein
MNRTGGGDLRISRTRELAGEEPKHWVFGVTRSRENEVTSLGTSDLGSRRGSC